jgi:hypothetical protein
VHLAIGIFSVIGMVVLEEGEAVASLAWWRNLNTIYTAIPAEDK